MSPKLAISVAAIVTVVVNGWLSYRHGSPLSQTLTAFASTGLLMLLGYRLGRDRSRETLDRHQAATIHHSGEDGLRRVLDSAQIGLWDWNFTTHHIRWSEEHERLFGFAPGTFDGTEATFKACVHPDDRAAFIQTLEKACETCTDYQHEYRIVWADGSTHWIESRGIFDDNIASNEIRLLGTVRDISTRKQAECVVETERKHLALRVAERTADLLRVNQQLQHELDERQKAQADLQMSQTQFAGILDIAEDAIISIDAQQKITLFNQGAERIFGYTAAEVLGQPLDLLLPQRFTQTHRQHIADFSGSPVQARRMGERREIYGRRKNGSEFPADASISKFDSGTGTVFTVFLQDVTERKQIDRMKDEFVSVVSHELRTPLTSIHGSLGMLASGLLKPDSDQGKRMLEIAVDSTDRLVRLINDILDIERIESGRVKMEKTVCQVEDLITEAINVVQPLADKAGVTLAVTGLPMQIQADPDRIVQTLTNLLSNAIKFSPSGNTVWLTAEMGKGQEAGFPERQPTGDRGQASQSVSRREAEGSNQRNSAAPTSLSPPAPPAPHSILFTVKDQGRGIPADKLDSIFERFQQVDSSDSRNHEGTGLGLAICRSIVQQHDGQIWVESVVGEGSTFSFTVPALETLALKPRDLPTGLATAPLVMICDHDPTITSLLQTLLEQQHYRVISTALGEDAIAQAIAQRPNVILLDLLLPNLNGWETLARLKQHAETQAIPIIICSISTPTELPLQATGYLDWVSKPLDEAALLKSLKQSLAKPSEQIRALIVEDDAALAKVLVTLFEQHEITAFHATTEREAIRLSQQVNPDLLVLDLVLPQGDGFAVVEWLQQHQRLRETPLVVYSGKDLNASERDRLQLGQTEFLSKGQVTIQEFEQRVMALLRQVTKADTSQIDTSQIDTSQTDTSQTETG